MPKNCKSRSGLLSQLIGLGLISNLSISVGLLPWLTLSAHGQAILLETNPNPEAPSFDIPTDVAPAPEAIAPTAPDVAYESEPYLETTPEPYFDPEPYVEPEPYVAPEPYVEEVAPVVEPPIVATPPTQTQPEYAPPSLSQGCAALLDLSATATECGPSPTGVENTPSIPLGTAPAVIANESGTAPIQEKLPPARRVQAAPAPQRSLPPARQLTAVVPEVNQFSQAPRSVTSAQLSSIPNYRRNALPSGSIASPRPTVGNGIVTANLPEIPGKPSQNFTVVKPDRYSLKPLNSRNPLQWILGEQAMLFPLPMPMAVSSAFGWRQHPINQSWHLHSGIDFAAPQGTPVVAVYDGQVAIADNVGGYGLSVLLSHNKGQRQTRYAHLSQIFVRPGQTVSQGDVLGSVGSTGKSTGPHLHFETLVKTPDGMVVVDPTEEVKIALINSLNQMQAATQNDSKPLGVNTAVVHQSGKTSGSTPAAQPPIPVEVIQPMSRYQASANLGIPLLTE